jgi:hypothetical protein
MQATKLCKINDFWRCVNPTHVSRHRAVWLEAMPINLGKVNKGGRFVGAGMSAPSIYSVVVEYAETAWRRFPPSRFKKDVWETRPQRRGKN